MSTKLTSRGRPRAHLLMMLLLAVACSEAPAGPDQPEPPEPPEEPQPADMDGYVADLGSWEDFAPPAEAVNEPVAPDTTREEVVEEPDSEGGTHPVTYVCTETPYSLTETPEEIVMYEPNASIMWVGALIQGESYKGGQGSFQELPIRQRSPVEISIDLLTGDNSAVVENPSLSTVNAAIGDLIQRAHDAGHRSGSSINFESQLSYSVEQAALALGLSAKYLGVKARADLAVSRSASEKALVAHFVQKMFTISMVLPQSPDAVFSDALTQELLQQQIDAGNIGRTNLPVYIASVTYGRTLTYTLTSTHSEERMRAAIAASYNGVVGGVSGYSEAELRETLSQQNIKVTAIGGEGQNVLDLIASGQLQAYFTEDAALTSARPLSYQLNFLGDNSIAKVAETTEYSLRECEQKVVIPGRFEYLGVQQGASPVATPYRMASGDVNGDGHGDLIWNHVVSGTNEIGVGLGQADGSFTVGTTITHPASPTGGWSNLYDMLVADIDGDGHDDLVFNRRDDAGPNRIFVAISNGDGTLDFRDEVQHPSPSWATGWRVLAGDLDGDQDDDLVWSWLGDVNWTWVGLSNGDGTFAFGERIDHPANGWGPYVPYIADVNSDQLDDLVWNVASGGNSNRTYVGLSKGDGTLNMLPYQDRGSAWSGYTTLIGDVNRDGYADFVWSATGRPEMALHRGFGQANGTFSFPGYQGIPHYFDDNRELGTYLGDFNDDGSSDVLWNDLSANTNHVWVGLGNEEGTFDFTPIDQEHPATDATSIDWTAFRGGVHVMDVDRDAIDDVVWVDRSGTYRIYTALGREPGA